jgi:hypothetical protein
MTNKKYTFAEFVGAIEADDFDNPHEDYLDWGNTFVDAFPNIMKTEKHGGDCTNEPYTCAICIYETLLKDYYEYCFNEVEWRIHNL